MQKIHGTQSVLHVGYQAVIGKYPGYERPREHDFFNIKTRVQDHILQEREVDVISPASVEWPLHIELYMGEKLEFAVRREVFSSGVREEGIYQ